MRIASFNINGIKCLPISRKHQQCKDISVPQSDAVDFRNCFIEFGRWLLNQC